MEKCIILLYKYGSKNDISPIVSDIRNKIQSFKKRKSEIDENRIDKLDIEINKDLLNSYKNNKSSIIEKKTPSPLRTNVSNVLFNKLD